MMMSEPDDQRRDGHSRLVVDKGKIVVDPESMSPHKRVSLEFGVALRQIAEVMKNEARLGQPFALGLDFYKLIEVQLEQRVAVLVARAEQKAYHDGRAVADHDRRRSDALFEEGRKVIDEQRGRLTRLALYAQ